MAARPRLKKRSKSMAAKLLLKSRLQTTPSMVARLYLKRKRTNMVAPLLQKSRITNNPIILQYSKKMTSTAHRVGSRSTASGWCCWLVSACLILLSGTLAAETIDPPPTQFYVDDIKAAMAKHVQSLTVHEP